jgi:hypothetical protein
LKDVACFEDGAGLGAQVRPDRTVCHFASFFSERANVICRLTKAQVQSASTSHLLCQYDHFQPICSRDFESEVLFLFPFRVVFVDSDLGKKEKDLIMDQVHSSLFSSSSANICASGAELHDFC